MAEATIREQSRDEFSTALPSSAVLNQRCLALLGQRGVAECCTVQVHRRQWWTVFEGRVDSHGTKVSLFGLVPEYRGARWIVDRLDVGAVR